MFVCLFLLDILAITVNFDLKFLQEEIHIKCLGSWPNQVCTLYLQDSGPQICFFFFCFNNIGLKLINIFPKCSLVCLMEPKSSSFWFYCFGLQFLKNKKLCFSQLRFGLVCFLYLFEHFGNGRIQLQ